MKPLKNCLPDNLLLQQASFNVQNICIAMNNIFTKIIVRL